MTFALGFTTPRIWGGLATVKGVLRFTEGNLEIEYQVVYLLGTHSKIRSLSIPLTELSSYEVRNHLLTRALVLRFSSLKSIAPFPAAQQHRLYLILENLESKEVHRIMRLVLNPKAYAIHSKPESEQMVIRKAF